MQTAYQDFTKAKDEYAETEALQQLTRAIETVSLASASQTVHASTLFGLSPKRTLAADLATLISQHSTLFPPAEFKQNSAKSPE